MISWLLALLASSQVPYELLALVYYSETFDKTANLKRKNGLCFFRFSIFFLSSLSC